MPSATDEPGAELYAEAVLASQVRRVSAATLLEAAIVIDRHPSPLAAPKFDQLVERFRFVVEPFTASQTAIARRAYQQFGKGSGHPAQLNFGDCFTYALVKELGEPLLFIGQDFVHTDLRSALPITVVPGSTGPVNGTPETEGTDGPGIPSPELDPFEAIELERCTPEMRGWYAQIKLFILGLGADVEARPRQGYVPFWRLGRPWRQAVFANANFRPTKNRLIIDIPKLDQDPPFDGEFLLPWLGQQKRDKVMHLVIDSDEDVDQAKPFIRRSYDSLD